MRRFAIHAVTAIALSSLAVLVPAPNASATVHEIVGQWCAGRGELFPPGLSGGSSADNFAKPLFATGVIESITPYLDGVLITFDLRPPRHQAGEHWTDRADRPGHLRHRI